MSKPDFPQQIRAMAREQAERLSERERARGNRLETALFVVGCFCAALVWLITVALWPAALVACCWLIARALAG